MLTRLAPRHCEANRQRVVAAEIDGDRVGSADLVGHCQCVVAGRAVDMLEVVEIEERTGSSGQIQRVVAAGSIDRKARDIVEECQRVIRGNPGRKVAVAYSLDVGDGNAVWFRPPG